MEKHVCVACGKPLDKRNGKKGAFWSCTGYPECKFTLDDDDGTPLTAVCPECGGYLRAGENSRGRYTACFNKENHVDGQPKFFDAEGKPRQSVQPNGEFACPECGSKLKYFIQKSGKNAGKPCFACFEQELHEDGKPRFYRDNNGAPEL